MEKLISILKANRYAKFLKFGISIIVIFGLFSCAQNTEQPTVLTKAPTQIPTINPADLPPPIKAKYIDPESVAPPMVVPLKGKPKVIPAHPNVHQVGEPKVVQIPKELKIVQLGKDVPLPKTFPAKSKVLPALQPKPKPIKALRAKDGAVFNIQFLSEEQGIYTVINAMLEDSRGHLWFVNPGYIGRYDGINFFVYSEKEGFLNDAVDVLEDSKGNVWFAGSEGLCSYDGTHVTHFNKETGLESNDCWALLEDSNGNIWFSNGTKNVYCYNGQNFTLFGEEQQLNNAAQKQLTFYSDSRIVDILEDSEGNIWWATQGSGVLRYDGQYITHFTEKEGLIHNYIYDMLEDNDGQIWFGSGGTGTIGLGVSRYNPNEGINGSFSNFTKKEGLSGNRISGMTKDKSGNIWLATYDGGITKYDGKLFTHFTPDEGLSFPTALCILADHKDNIWIGTNGGGVSRLQPNSFRHFTEQQGLSKNWVHSVIEDSKGNIWMSTYLGGAIKYDGENFMLYTEQEGLLQNIVNAILEDNKSNLWFSYRDNGVSKFDGQTFTHYTPERGLSGFFYWDLHEDNQGQIWIACGRRGGITRINPDNGQITHFIGNESEGIGRSAIMEDSEHSLWFGGLGWVATHNATKDQLEFKYNIDPIDKEWVNFLVEDRQKNRWFGTISNFVQVQINGNEIENDLPRLTIGKGLPNTEIASLIVDKSQNIWVGGAKNGLTVLKNGLNIFGQLDAPWVYYFKEDGLKSNNFQGGSLDSKNRLWLGSVQGITQLNLNVFQFPEEAPQNLSLSFIDLQGEFLDYSNLSNESYQNTLAFGEAVRQAFDSVAAFHNYPKNLNLPYNVNHLTFHFSAIDWSAPHNIQYSYKMDGIDKNWRQPSGEAKADYRNLPHGTFTFQVKAIGEAKVWSEPFTYTFTIRPPWWHTWWAYTLYAMIFLAALRTFSLWRERRLREEKEHLKQKVEERTGELKKKSEELEHSLEDLKSTQSQLIQSEKMASLGELTAGIAHEIQNPLNFVNNFSEVSNELIDEMNEELEKGDIEEAKAISEDIKQNLEKINQHGKRADAIVKGMLQHSQSSSGKNEPTDINALVDEFLRLSYHGLRAKDKSFNATLITEFDENIIDVNIVPQNIGRVILNLINNAFYAVTEKSREQPNEYQPTVTVITRNVNNGIEIVVKDNGNGIPTKIVDKIFQPFFTTKPAGQGTGLGLSLSYDIVKAHGGEITVNSEEGIGTEFKISLLT